MNVVGNSTGFAVGIASAMVSVVLGRRSCTRWLLMAVPFARELLVEDRTAAAATLTVQRTPTAVDCPDATTQRPSRVRFER